MNPAIETVNVLIVDDESRNLDALESILESVPGLRLIRALRPEEALMALLQNEFACIILDIQMPGMSGIELARQIKTRKRNQHIPIIFLTAFFLDDKDVILGYGAGAVDYLTKPINPEILKSKVGVFVDLFRTARALAAANDALAMEVNQRKMAEEALRLANNDLEKRVQDRTAELAVSQERYKQVVRNLPLAIYTTDSEGRITLYNEPAVELWGRRPVIGRDLWCGSYKIFKVDGKELLPDECPMAVTLKTGEPVRGQEIIIERPDGSRRNILPYPTPIRDSLGRITGGVNLLLDITERKRNERQQRALFELVATMNAAPSINEICNAALDAIVQCYNADRASILLSDSEGVMRFKAWRGLSDEYRRAVEGHSPWKPDETPEPIFISDFSKTDLIKDLRAAIEKEGVHSLAFIPVTYEKRLLGKFVVYFNSLHSFTHDELRPAQTIASQIAFAIERENVLQQLKRAHEELLAASRAKDDFLATLSHELRTPLNPVLLLASDAVDNRDLPPRVRTDFNTIRKNIEMEARLIDDLLDLTRIERGKIILEKKLINLRSVLHDAVAQVREEIDQKQITLDLQFKATHHTVFADAVRLQQIFWNLLKNAVKFTPEQGKIMVETSQDNGTLSVKISDTGIGITPEEIGGIFNAFSQSHSVSGNGNRFAGLGLGLSISQKLAELHSGKILATSDGRNKGAVFTVELPLASTAEGGRNLAAEKAPGSTPGSTAKGIRILLVEDHEPTRTTLAGLLARRRYQVAEAATVAEARALAGARSFDLLITDIGLPDGNGYDLMVELGKKNHLRGIALTGYGMEHDVARSQNVGFDAHLTKPVRIQSLEEALKTTFKNMETEPD